MSRIRIQSISCLLLAGLALVCANTIQAQSRLKHKPRHVRSDKTAATTAPQARQPEGEIIGRRISFSDGSALNADEVWKQGEEFWYRTGGVTQRIDRPIRTIDPIRAEPKKEPAKLVAAPPAVSADGKSRSTVAFWIYLKGGARMKVEDVAETDAGAWYQRDTLSIFIERDRIERIERDSGRAKQTGWRERGWTTGNGRIDELIRSNSTRFGLDPYLVFCVIEHESHFHVRAISPKGARGLMQLMPGTASRFGVRRPFDPAENIFGGTQYLKELLKMFDGRLDLVLASYNAGEGAVIKYGGNVPPYRETRDYVRRITRRYGTNTSDAAEKISAPPQ
ncbi:MAG TPA: lytic transglycosylase domain-containing protein [Pyrinomonadaceae bacterium]|nr:lytic transglycosylase domain-containing protein [Pyrinomonadaceae bacterium]